jgi:type IV secretory pathway VirB9-like protein
MNRIKYWPALLLASLSVLSLVACSTTNETAATSSSLGAPKLAKFSSRKIDDRYTVKNQTGLLSKMPIWAPERVYNDGASVYIEIPARNSAAIAFYVYDNQSKLVAIPYQKNKHFYRVDVLFEKALLVKGQVPNQEKILITYDGTHHV